MKPGDVILFKGQKVTIEFFNKRMLNVVWFDKTNNLKRDSINIGRIDQIINIIKESL